MMAVRPRVILRDFGEDGWNIIVGDRFASYFAPSVDGKGFIDVYKLNGTRSTVFLNKFGLTVKYECEKKVVPDIS